MEIDKNIVIVFDGNQISGHSGCNSFNGEATIDGNLLSFGDLASTLMLCPDDEVNQREAEFLAALNNAASYTIKRQALTLLDANDETTALFIVGEAVELVGTQWQWTRFEGSAASDNIDVADPTSYTLMLVADDTFAFQADCNSGNGSYTIENDSLTIELGPISTAACEPDSLDSVFLAKLGERNTFQLDANGNLILAVETGNMIFEPNK